MYYKMINQFRQLLYSGEVSLRGVSVFSSSRNFLFIIYFN